MRVKRSKLKAFIRREFRRQDLSEGFFSDILGGRRRDRSGPAREGGYPPGVEEDIGKDVDKFYRIRSDDMITREMSASEAADAFEESASGFGTDEGKMFSALYWGAGEIPDAEAVIEDETGGYEKDVMMWVATEDKAQELFDISSGEWIFPEEEEPEEEEEEESGRDKRKLDRQAKQQARQEKRKGRREDRQEKRGERREDRQERREDRREERGERREDRQAARGERREDRQAARGDRQAARGERREDRQERREERSEMSGRERRQSRRSDRQEAGEERRGRRRSRRMGDEPEEDDA